MVWVLGQKLQNQEAQLLDLEGGKKGGKRGRGREGGGRKGEGGKRREGWREGRGGREKGGVERGVEGGERNDCEVTPHGYMKLANGVPVCCQGKHSCR